MAEPWHDPAELEVDPMPYKRRVLLIELDTPTGRWDSKQVELELNNAVPYLHPVVHGEFDVGLMGDGAWRKLRQASRESDHDLNRQHTIHMAMTFLCEALPTHIAEMVRERGL